MTGTKPYGVDQGEWSGGVKLESVGIVGFDLLCLEHVALEGDFDGERGLLVASELGVFGDWLCLLRSDWLGLFLLGLLFLGSLLGGGLGGGFGRRLSRSDCSFGVGLGFLRRSQYERAGLRRK
jgi:hypothetical protein